MSATRIASRYAKSLLDLAVDRKELDLVLKDILYVKDALRVRDLFLLIKSPIINPSKKKSIFKRLFSSKLSQTTDSFFHIMIRKGREPFLPEIVDSFIEQYKEYKNISTVVIKTAVPLDEHMINDIQQKLKSSDILKRNLEVKMQIDPELIGGFTLEFEGRQYDSSIANKLQKLRKQFSN